MRAGLRGAVKVSVGFSLLVSALIWLFGANLMGLFIDAGEGKRDGDRRRGRALSCASRARSTSPSAACFLFYGLYRAIGRPGMSVVLTVISLGARVALAYALSAIPALGVVGIWWSVPIGWFLADAAGLFLLPSPIKSSSTPCRGGLNSLFPVCGSRARPAFSLPSPHTMAGDAPRGAPETGKGGAAMELLGIFHKKTWMEARGVCEAPYIEKGGHALAARDAATSGGGDGLRAGADAQRRGAGGGTGADARGALACAHRSGGLRALGRGLHRTHRGAGFDGGCSTATRDRAHPLPRPRGRTARVSTPPRTAAWPSPTTRTCCWRRAACGR